jgi:hypothetical protein
LQGRPATRHQKFTERRGMARKGEFPNGLHPSQYDNDGILQ